ncbi:hypothetical protein EWM64_g4848 [Hericium alpestre]|uniref:Uncharacterized protein n=1 Tax=Hericium alpestre TaxID=135208 RepID=A0A4Y9ZYP6_9AGAM|nr:hypothetical protein EWM64_g4848 [Hericium alpestre]
MMLLTFPHFVNTLSPPLPRASPEVAPTRASQRLRSLLGPPPQPQRSRLAQPSDPRPFLPSLDFEEARDSFWSDLDDDASESAPYHQLRDEIRRRISNRDRRAAAALETNFGLRTVMENEREHRRLVSRSRDTRQARSDNLWDFLDSTEVGGPGRVPSPNDRNRMDVDDFDEDWRRFREEIRGPTSSLSHGPPGPSSANRPAHEDDRRSSNAGRDTGGITIVEVGASGDPIRPPIDYSPRLRGADLDLFSDLNLIPANSSGTNNLDFLFSSEEAQPLLPTGDGYGRSSAGTERDNSRSGYGYPTTRPRPPSFTSRYPDTSRSVDGNLDPTLARLSSELLRGNNDDLRTHWGQGPRRPSPPSRSAASELNTRIGDRRVQNLSGSDNEAPTFSSLLPEIEPGSPLLFDRHEPPVIEHRDMPPSWAGPGSTRTPSTASWRQYYNSSLYERTVMNEEGDIRPRYPPRPADQPSNRASSTSLSEVPTTYGSLSRWDRPTSSDDPVSIQPAQRSWDWMNEDIPPPTPRYPWRSEIPRPPSPESNTESSFALRSRLMEMRRASAATARVRLARSAHLANRASSPSSMSALPRGRRGEDVPFSNEAAALFASRPTSPPPSGGLGDLSGGEEPRGRDGHRIVSSMYAPPPSVGMSTAPTWHRPSSGSLHGPQELPVPSSMAFRRRPNAQGPTTDGPHEHSAPPSSSAFGRGMPPRLEELPVPMRRPARATERERSTVDMARDRLPGGAYRNIDLDAYHEGPFRASLERLVEIDRLRARREALLMTNEAPRRSRPPTIPPLQFDNDHEVWPFGNRPALCLRRAVPRLLARMAHMRMLGLLAVAINTDSTRQARTTHRTLLALCIATSHRRPMRRTRALCGTDIPARRRINVRIHL